MMTGTNVGLLPDAARSVANGYFLHPKKEQAGAYRNGTPFSCRGALIQGTVLAG